MGSKVGSVLLSFQQHVSLPWGENIKMQNSSTSPEPCTKRVWFCAGIAAFWVMLFVFPAHAAVRPGVDMALEQKKQNAIVLLQNQKHEDAYAAFMRLLREIPDDEDVNMGIALSASATKRHAQALMAYERLLLKHPQDARLRIEVAKVYLALDEPESARLELAKAREYDPNISDKDIDTVLEALSAQFSRWHFKGRLSIGGVYDDNANQGPRSNYMTLGNFENLFVDGVKKQESWGLYLANLLEAGYRLDDDNRWWLMTDFLGYQRWNTSAINTNNSFSYGRFSMGPRYMGKKIFADFRVQGNAANQHHRSSRDQHINSFGPELTFALLPSSGVQFLTRAGIEKRHYSLSSVRNGSYWHAGEFVRVFFGESNHEIMVGASASGSTDATIKAYRYKAIEPSLRVTFKLPYDVSFSPFVSFREERYKGPATGLETENRRDEQWRMGAGLVWEINQSFEMDMNYQHVNSNSNSALYQYDQNAVTMGVTLKF